MVKAGKMAAALHPAHHNDLLDEIGDAGMTAVFADILALVTETASTLNMESDVEDGIIAAVLKKARRLLVEHKDEPLSLLDFCAKVGNEHFGIVLRMILGVAASSANVEGLFSNAGDILTKKRSRLSDDNVRALLLGNCFFRLTGTKPHQPAEIAMHVDEFLEYRANYKDDAPQERDFNEHSSFVEQEWQGLGEILTGDPNEDPDEDPDE